MADATIAVQKKTSRTRLDPQRKAWGVLLISFAIFCMTCVVTSVGVYYFLFQSTIPLDMSVRVGRGSIGVAGQFVPQQRGLSFADELSTGGESQATVFLRDPQGDGRLIASITLSRDTNLTLRRAVRPRFDWSANPYSIEFEGLSGDVDVFVARDLDRDFWLTITTPNGSRVDLGASGLYTLSAREGQVRLVNREGRAVMITGARGEGRDIPPDAQGIVTADAPGEIAVSPAYTNLLQNSTFQDTIQVANDSGQLQQVTQVWGCTNSPSTPRGSYRTETKDGRITLRLVRADDATSHGETRCLAYFGQNGRDVHEYDYLEMRVSLNLNYQSLPVCGWEGSECPLMLQIEYQDQDGDLHTWRHGFYYLAEPQLNYPLSCNTCKQDHDAVNEKSWYTYSSGNLLALLGPDEQPVGLWSVQFYASGHQYDVSIGEVSLLAGQVASGPALPPPAAP